MKFYNDKSSNFNRRRNLKEGMNLNNHFRRVLQESYLTNSNPKSLQDEVEKRRKEIRDYAEKAYHENDKINQELQNRFSRRRFKLPTSYKKMRIIESINQKTVYEGFDVTYTIDDKDVQNIFIKVAPQETPITYVGQYQIENDVPKIIIYLISNDSSIFQLTSQKADVYTEYKGTLENFIQFQVEIIINLFNQLNLYKKDVNYE